MRSGHQVRAQAGGVVLHFDIAHGNGGHVQAQRVPVVAVIEGNPDLGIGGSVQQTLLARILANRIGGRAARDAVHDLGPSLAAVVRAPQVRIHVVQAQRISSGVGRPGVEVAGVHVEDARPGFHRRGRDVGPLLAAVHGDLDQAVARACPQDVDVERRRRQSGDGAHGAGRDGRPVFAGIRRNIPLFAARQIATDGRPAMSAVGRLPDSGSRVEQSVGILGGPVQRLGSHGARRRRIRGQFHCCASSTAGSDVAFLAGDAIIKRYLAAVDQIGIFRIWRGVAVFFNAHRMPVVERDLAVHAAAVDAGRAGILLPAAQAIRKRVVRGDVIHRRRGLRVPVAPGFAAIGGNHGALIADEQNNT